MMKGGGFCCSVRRRKSNPSSLPHLASFIFLAKSIMRFRFVFGVAIKRSLGGQLLLSIEQISPVDV